MGKIARHPNPGTVLGAIGAGLGLVALIVSLSSSAGAVSRQSHALVRRGDLAPGAVTAKALAKGAVHAKALAGKAVHPKALAKGAVTPAALADDAVTAAAIAPGSVYGGALGTVTRHTAPIVDTDESPSPGSWTASESPAALCATGERLLSGGIVFTNPGNREVGVLEVLPFADGNASGVLGRITSNSAGSAAAEVVALCLK